MTKFVIIGAGMAGLLAANMLRSSCSKVVEAQSSLPNNHHAVLRFRSSVVSDALNIPFKRVEVLKASHSWKNPVADALAYSMKTNGSYSIRSSVMADGQLSERFIAPPDFISQMAEGIQDKIEYETCFEPDRSQPTISTIPMPTLMGILGYKKKPEFSSRKGIILTAEIEDCDAYCSLYVPDPIAPFSRISLTGSHLMVECGYESCFLNQERANETIYAATTLLGFTERSRIKAIGAKESRYHKILPIDEHERKKFIIWASEEHRVYSIGRFATWRPGLLLDDVVNDIRVVQSLEANQHSYEQKRRTR